jgi:L,D-peptidoglycan transpeptidase YkuD (ErfK/YbiS/YcfS/YnhG family)
MRLVAFILFVLSAPAMIAAPDPLRQSRQCLVVVSRDWNAKTAVLRAYERKNSRSEWRIHGPEIPVGLGKTGLAWGRGLAKPDRGTLPIKREGDNKAPAGIFRVGPAFGYAPAHRARWVKLRYLPLTKQIEGIDDPRSRSYNQLVDRSKVRRVDWRSSEQMLRDDDLYKWGVLVEHNTPSQPGAGSCIFVHIWKSATTPTTGCTAMSEQNLVRLLGWLDPAAHPLLLQMPRQQYDAFRAKFVLPNAH